MTLTYALDKEDFLQYQLFLASKSDRIRKQRLRSRLIVSGSMLALGLVFYQKNDLLFYYFIGVAILSFLLYPSYQRKHYRRHYDRFISEHYQNRFGQSATIRFAESTIEMNDSTGQSTLNLSELESVTEIGGYFYPKFRSGGHIIIPKSKVAQVEELRAELKELCERLQIPFLEDLAWKWR